MNQTPRLGDTLREILAQTPSQAQSKTLLQLLSEPDIKVPFLWGEIFPKGEFLGIVGKSGVNKSTFCRQLCLSIASRQTAFLNDELTPTYGKAMYCFSEENENWIRRYLRKNCNGIEYNMRDLENMTVVNMQNFDTGEEMLTFFREELSRQKFDLIVIDSYSDFIVKFNAKLNDNDSIRVLKSQIEFLKDGGCSILFNHHTSDKASALGTFLGANAFKQIVRSQLEIFDGGAEWGVWDCESSCNALD
ncbi:MAG: AAA family ATPase [Ignavibacteriae bacterium]|nr:AAA family ATPase [Ignavibacteriota bacterium]